MTRINTTKLGLTLVLVLSFSFLLYSNSATLGSGFCTKHVLLLKSYLERQLDRSQIKMESDIYNMNESSLVSPTDEVAANDDFLSQSTQETPNNFDSNFFVQIADLSYDQLLDQYFQTFGNASSFLSSQSLSRRVNAISDDAEEKLTDNSMYLNSSDLELCTDLSGSVNQLVGIRFNDINLSSCVTINSAYIEFEVDEVNSDPASVTIWGEDIDNAPTFTTTASNISTRTKTAASVAWNSIGVWDVADQKKSTPDLTSIVQEIIDRPGWTANNSLAFIIGGTGTRIAESFDGEATAAPLLVIDYIDCSGTGRVTSGLLALYDFQEGSGTTVNDVSGNGTPLNLTIADPANVSWLNDGLGGISINSGTIIESAGPATKISDAIKTSNEMTVEVWIKPDNLNQSGPARIATISSGAYDRHFTLGVQNTDYAFRARTTDHPQFKDTYGGSVKTSIQHVLVTWDTGGSVKYYIDGVHTDTETISGSTSNWTDTYKFGLANEFLTDRIWLGEIYLAAVYDRALTESEVVQNYFDLKHLIAANYNCTDGQDVEVLWEGLENAVPKTMTFTNPSEISKVVVDILYLGNNPGTSISITDNNGASYSADRQQYGADYLYRFELPGGISSVTYSNESYEASAQSMVCYNHREKLGSKIEVLTDISLYSYNSLEYIHLPIPLGEASRDVKLEIPFSEITLDDRYIKMVATAGGVGDSITKSYGVGSLPNGCCVDLIELNLVDVPANTTEVVLKIDSRDSEFPTSGQSYFITGTIATEIECSCPSFTPQITSSAPLTVLNQAITFSTTAVSEIENEEFEWDFGPDANPATATGLGPHSVSWSSSGVKPVTLVVANNACEEIEVKAIPVTSSASCGCGDNVLSNPGFETSASGTTFPTSFQGVNAKGLLNDDALTVPGWLPGIPEKKMFYFDDSADAVNNPEGDHFVWLPKDGYCWVGDAHFGTTLNLEHNKNYKVCFYAAAWNEDLDANGDPTGNAVTQMSSGVSLEFTDHTNTTNVVASYTLPTSPDFNNLNWQHFSYTFKHNSAEPFKNFLFTSQGQNAGVAIDEVTIAEAECTYRPVEDCGTGKIGYELWTGTNSWDLGGLTSHKDYPDYPTTTGELTNFSFVQNGTSSNLSFDGVDDHIDLGNDADLQITGDMTIAMWLHPTEFSARRNPWSKAYGGEGTITQETSGYLNFYWGTGGGNASPYTQLSTGSAIALNEWTHVAVVRDLTNGEARWYINGQLSSSAARTMAGSVSSLTAKIGKGYVSNYKGGIDDVRVYDCALTTQEIVELSNQNSCLKAHWTFEEGSGTVVNDSKGNVPQANITGGATWETRNAYGYDDYYGTRTRGSIQPTETGTYYFNVTSDNQSVLYLSTDNDPLNVVEIASVPDYAGLTEHTKHAEQSSVGITLTAGEIYYVELLHSEGNGDDFFAVYWKTPSNSTWTIIDGAYLGEYCTLTPEDCSNCLDDDGDGLQDCNDPDCPCFETECTQTVLGETSSASKKEGTTLSWNHTVSSDDNFLIVPVTVNNNKTVQSVTYNSTNLTLAKSGTFDGRTLYIYYLGNPTTGTHQVYVNTGSGDNCDLTAGAINYKCVDLSNPFPFGLQETHGQLPGTQVIGNDISCNRVVGTMDFLVTDDDNVPSGNDNLQIIDVDNPSNAEFLSCSIIQEPGTSTGWTLVNSEHVYIHGCLKAKDGAMSGCEVCDNGIDDDGDGLVDCADSDCPKTTIATAKDTYIWETSPDANSGSSTTLYSGVVSSGLKRSLIEFDLSNIPACSEIQSATFSIYRLSGGAYTEDVEIHRITAPWDENSVTWNTFNDKYDSHIWSTFSADGTSWISADVKELVQSWVSGNHNNYGLLLDILQGNSEYKSYKSSEYGDGSYAPYLEVCYVQGTCPEICFNGIDDDGDGLIDYEDPDCGIYCENNLLTNPGFETGLTDWDSNNFTVTTDAFSGVKAATISGTNGYLTQNKTGTEGDIFVVNAYAKNTGSEESVVGIKFFDAAWTQLSGVYLQVNSSNYELRSGMAKAPAGTVHAQAFLSKDAGAGSATFDDLCFEKFLLTTSPTCSETSCLLSPSNWDLVGSFDDTGSDDNWLDYLDGGSELCYNGDGTMTIKGVWINGQDAGWQPNSATPCGSGDAWIFELDLFDRQTWSQFGGSYQENNGCVGNYENFDYWDFTGTMTGVGCNEGRTVDITGPAMGYRMQIGTGGNNQTCDFGMSTWFVGTEGNTSVKGDIYLHMDENCYTPPTNCSEYDVVSTDVPIAIPTTLATVTSTVNITDDGVIEDLNVLNLDISHTYIDDLIVTLTSPAGTIVNILNRPCSSEDDVLINFDDEAASSTYPCPPTDNGTYIPFSALSAFDGEDIQGIWTLTVEDVYAADGGSINAWELDFTVECSGPEICNNGVDDDGDGLSDCSDPACGLIHGGSISMSTATCPQNDPSELLNQVYPVWTAAHSCNNVLNSEFDNLLLDWDMYLQSGSNAAKTIDATGLFSGDNCVYVDVTQATGGIDWHIQFVQEGLSIVEGQEYTVMFQAKSAAPKTIRAALQLDVSPWTHYWEQSVDLTTTPTLYGPFTFVASTTITDHASLIFNLGEDDTDVWFDAVYLSESNCEESKVAYKWESRTSDGSGGWNAWTNISGATSISYDPGPISVATEYRRFAKMQNCDSWLNSNSVTVELCPDPFACDSKFYQTIKLGSDYWLYEIITQPVSIDPLINLNANGVVGELNAIIFNKNDGLIYAINPEAPHRLYRIGGDLSISYLGEVNGFESGAYVNAADMGPDGTMYYRDPGNSGIYSLDIETLNVTLLCDYPENYNNGSDNIGDIAYNPIDGKYYGTHDSTNVLSALDFDNCTETNITMDYNYDGANGAFYISADGFGYGYQNLTGNLTRINLSTGEVEIIGTGASTEQTDGCSCEGLKFTKEVSPDTTAFDATVTYTFSVYNYWPYQIADIEFKDTLLGGMTWASEPYNLSGGITVGSSNIDGNAIAEFDINLVPQGITTFKIDAYVPANYSGDMPNMNQAWLGALPTLLGDPRPSDYPPTPELNDPTPLHFFENCVDGIDNDNDGLVDCNDPYCQRFTISNKSIGACVDHPLQDIAVLSFDLAWVDAPSNNEIIVEVLGKEVHIDLPGGATSPQSFEFNVPADASSGNTITVSWSDSDLCDAVETFDTPAACSSDRIYCDILYLCGQDKPLDGDPWDHGWIEYLDLVNGTNNVLPILTKADGSGLGTYDPMNPSTFVTVDFNAYELIVISPTTEGYISNDLLTLLKDHEASILNMNYTLLNDLGMTGSEGSYLYRDYAYTDNTTSEVVYNFQNPNPKYGTVILRGDYISVAEANLWANSNDMSNNQGGVQFSIKSFDNIPGIASTHGKRVFLGYHMDGVYADASHNNPASQSDWFNPTLYLTEVGKIKMDEAIISASAVCNSEDCDNGIDDDDDGLVDCDDPECTLTCIDPCDALASGNTDTDNDGVSDICDLDDDNDGILDTDECNLPTGTMPASSAFNWNTTFLGGSIDTYIGCVDNTGDGYQQSGFERFVYSKGLDITNLDTNNDFTFSGTGNSTITTFNNGTVTFDSSLPGGIDFFAEETTSANFVSGTSGDGIFMGVSQIGMTSNNYMSATIDFTTPVYAFSCDVIDIFDNESSGPFSLKVDVLVNGIIAAYLQGDFVGDDLIGYINLYDNLGTLKGPLLVGHEQETSFGFLSNVEINDVTILYTVLSGTALGTEVFGLDNFAFTTPCAVDTDGDGISNELDTDSDNDGCPDALEGANNLTTTATLIGGSNGGSSDNLGTTVDADGIPTVSGSPQGNTAAVTDDLIKSGCVEICDNGIDDNGDGLVDCLDPDCPCYYSINLALCQEPEIASSGIGADYVASTQALSAVGYAVSLLRVNSQGAAEVISNGQFGVSATVDNSGNLVSGTVWILGDVAEFNDTLITGSIVELGYVLDQTTQLEIVFTARSGSMLEMYGGKGNRIGAVLSLGVTGAVDWTTTWFNNQAGVAELAPANCPIGGQVRLDDDRDGDLTDSDVSIEGSEVSIFEDTDCDNVGDVFLKKDTTDADGNYYFRDMPSGCYVVVQSDLMYHYSTNDADFVNDGQISSVQPEADKYPSLDNDYLDAIIPEDCNNGVDDDGDGLIDCLDPDCTLDLSLSKIDVSCDMTVAGQINASVTGNAPFNFVWSDDLPTAHYTFEETTDDVSGNGHHQNVANSQGTISFEPDAYQGEFSAYFDGTDYLRYSIDGAFMEITANKLAVGMWIKPDALSGIQMLFEEGGSTNGFGMRLEGDQLIVAARNASAQFNAGAITFPADGQWHHVLGIFEDSKVTAYLDGVAGTSTATTFSQISSHSGNGGFGNMDGTSAFGTYAFLPYSGKMDEIRYYHNSAPNQDQITDYIRNDGDRFEMVEGSYSVTVTGQSGCSDSGSVAIIGGANYTDGGTISNDKSICLGNSTTVIANITAPSGGNGPIEYEWYESSDGSNWTLISGATGDSYSIGAIDQTTWYQRRARRVNCTDWNSSNTCKVTVSDNFTSGGVIDGDEEQCDAYDPMFINVISAPTGGNDQGTVSYKWEQSTNGGASWNGITAAFGATYDPPTITQTTHYRRGVTRGYCLDWQYSNVVEKAVVYDFVDGGTIAGTEEQCGTYDPISIYNADFPSGGNGGTIVYKWEQSIDGGITWTLIQNADEPNYDPSTITQTTHYKRISKRTPCSAWMTSNVIVKGVVQNFDYGGAIIGNETNCEAFDPTEITSQSDPSGSVGGTTTYQWQFSLDGGQSWSTIVGATSETYDPDMIAVTTHYRRGAKAAPCTNYAYSNVIAKIVVTNYTAGGTISGQEEFCNGYDPDMILSTTEASGGSNGTPTYAWELSTDMGNSWTLIPGETNNELNPDPITTTTFYRRSALRSPCATKKYSNVVKKLVVETFSDPGSIAGNESFCNAYDPTTIVNTQSPTGGMNGALEYKWQKSTDEGDTWTDVLVGIIEYYNPPTIAQTTWFRRGARLSPCSNYVYSNVVIKEVAYNHNDGGQIGSDEDFCGGYDPELITSLIEPSGGVAGSNIFKWQYSIDDGTTWLDISNSNSNEYDPPAITQTTSYRRGVSYTPCVTWVYANTVQKKVRDIPVAEIIEVPSNGSGYVCENESGAFEALDQGDGAVYTWDFGANATPGSATGKGPHLVSFDTPANDQLLNVDVSLTVVKDNCSDSDSESITVRPEPQITAINSTDPTTCSGNDGVITLTTEYPSGMTVETTVDGGLNWFEDKFSYNDLTAGSYHVQIRYNDDYCTNINGTVELSDPIAPNARIIIDDPSYCFGDSASVQASWVWGLNVDYTWDFGPNASPATATGRGPHKVKFDTTGLHLITLDVVKDGCLGTDQDEVPVVLNLTDPGEIGDDEEGCNQFDPSEMTERASPQGGVLGTLEYQWEQRTADNFGGWQAWNDISGANGQTYDPSVILVSTQYRRKVRLGPCSDWLSSNIVTKHRSVPPQFAEDLDYETSCPGEIFYENILIDAQYLGNNYSLSVIDQPTNGALILHQNGDLIYSPNSRYCGDDEMTVLLCNDGVGCCDTAFITIDLNDASVPDISNIPADITINCDEQIPLPPTILVQDNCNQLSVELDETSTQGIDDCSLFAYTLTKTWTAVDYCGNSVAEEQIITIEDETAPDIFRIYTLPNDKRLVAGVIENVSHKWKIVRFPIQFDTKPLVFVQVNTEDDATAVQSRIRNVSTTQFELRLTEEEALDDIHYIEDVAWVAVERGTNSQDKSFEAELISLSVADQQINFQQTYSANSPVFGQVQSFYEADPFGIRYLNQTANGVQVNLQEETSADAETGHILESFGYFVFEQAGDIKNKNGEVFGEIGRTTIDHTWKSITTPKTFKNPIVIFGGLSSNEADGGTVRVKNVGPGGFDVKLTEWEYLNGIHATETVSYMIIEGSVPFDTTFSCSAIEDAPQIGMEIIGVDNCDNTIGLSFHTMVNQNDCVNGNIMTRTWSSIDECDNEVSYSQMITIIDTIPPDFTVPANITINCTEDKDDLSLTGNVTDEWDDCTTSLNATYVDSLTGLQNCVEVVQVYRKWSLLDACGNGTVKTQIITVANRGVSVRVKIFLQGALAGGENGLMRDDLRAQGLLPLEEPYSELRNATTEELIYDMVGGGGERVDSTLFEIEGPDAIVDWVLIEIREPLYGDSIIAVRAALLQRDGDVVDVDGVSALHYPELYPGSYHVAVRHRNHLGVMTNITPVLTTSFPTPVNLTDVNYESYANFSRVFAPDGSWAALWGGDYNGDKRAIYQGPENDIHPLFFQVLTDPGNADVNANYIKAGYQLTDFDLDGRIIYQGPNNEKGKLLFNVILASPENIYKLPNFIINEKLP